MLNAGMAGLIFCCSDCTHRSGLYRVAWLLQTNHDPDDSFVMKQQLLSADEEDWEREVNAESLLMNQREGIIMERLSDSPRIVDIYGLCGTAIFVEAMSQNSLPLVIPGSGFGSPLLAQETAIERMISFLPLRQSPKRTTLNAEEKLDLAITMAEAIADMHGFSGGPIICSDVSLTQYLCGSDYSKQRAVKLNDFNIASMPQWNTQEGKYCPVNRPKWAGRVSLFCSSYPISDGTSRYTPHSCPV